MEDLLASSIYYVELWIQLKSVSSGVFCPFFEGWQSCYKVPPRHYDNLNTCRYYTGAQASKNFKIFTCVWWQEYGNSGGINFHMVISIESAALKYHELQINSIVSFLLARKWKASLKRNWENSEKKGRSYLRVIYLWRKSMKHGCLLYFFFALLESLNWKFCLWNYWRLVK